VSEPQIEKPQIEKAIRPLGASGVHQELKVEEIAPEQAESAIKKLSESKPKLVSEFMAMMGSGPMVNPLHQKMGPEHITQMLDLAAKHDERVYDLQCRSGTSDTVHQKSIRRYAFAYFAVIFALIITVLFLFKDKPEILVPVLSGIGGLVGGFLGGYGLGKQESK
jgi:hypothetical protein